METLQGLSASELSSGDGRKWRTIYSDPDNAKREGLDSIVWPEAFERMEDVYKRQQMNYSRHYSTYASGGTAAVLSKQKPLSYEEQIQEFVRRVQEAVSYTHLDVYKRQQL